jgi:hypothetical protein
MDKSVSVVVGFLVLIIFSLILPVSIYAYMERKKAIWRLAIRGGKAKPPKSRPEKSGPRDDYIQNDDLPKG